MTKFRSLKIAQKRKCKKRLEVNLCGPLGLMRWVCQLVYVGPRTLTLGPSSSIVADFDCFSTLYKLPRVIKNPTFMVADSIIGSFFLSACNTREYALSREGLVKPIRNLKILFVPWAFSSVSVIIQTVLARAGGQRSVITKLLPQAVKLSEEVRDRPIPFSDGLANAATGRFEHRLVARSTPWASPSFIQQFGDREWCFWYQKTLSEWAKTLWWCYISAKPSFLLYLCQAWVWLHQWKRTSVVVVFIKYRNDGSRYWIFRLMQVKIDCMDLHARKVPQFQKTDLQ